MKQLFHSQKYTPVYSDILIQASALYFRAQFLPLETPFDATSD